MTTLSPEPNRVLTLTGIAQALSMADIYRMLGLETACDVLEAVRVARNRRTVRALKDELEPVGYGTLGEPLYAHQLGDGND